MSNGQTLGLVAALRALQAANRWSDQELADQIGVTRPMWSMTKDGSTRFGFKTLAKVYERFPRLKPELADYLIQTLRMQGAPIAVLGYDTVVLDVALEAVAA